MKRAVAGFTIADRNNELTRAEADTVTLAAIRAYREAMAQFAGMGVKELWYAGMTCRLRSASSPSRIRVARARQDRGRQDWQEG